MIVSELLFGCSLGAASERGGSHSHSFGSSSQLFDSEKYGTPPFGAVAHRKAEVTAYNWTYDSKKWLPKAEPELAQACSPADSEISLAEDGSVPDCGCQVLRVECDGGQLLAKPWAPFLEMRRRPQAGTKTLFKAVRAFEKREGCDEAWKSQPCDGLAPQLRSQVLGIARQIKDGSLRAPMAYIEQS